jgi:predicted DNA-binding ribbon-helix-helix protein
MTLTNLDNERGNLLNLINSLEVTVSELPAPYTPPPPEPAISDASGMAEVGDVDSVTFNALVDTVNDILAALRNYGVIESPSEGG